MQDPPICPLCLRPIPPGAEQSLHHLIPKLKGGKGGPVVLLHQICHNEIHATLTEAELARSYATPEALRAHPRLEKFANWVTKRPPEFQFVAFGADKHIAIQVMAEAFTCELAVRLLRAVQDGDVLDDIPVFEPDQEGAGGVVVAVNTVAAFRRQ